MEWMSGWGKLLFALEGARSVLEPVVAGFRARRSLRVANLRAARLRDTNLCRVNLCAANLCGADLFEADLRYVDLSYAALGGADLRYADLRGVNLSSAYLGDALLSGADLRDANLRHADLRDAVLCGVDLSGAVLRGAILRGGLRDVPAIPRIHQAVYAAARQDEAFAMDSLPRRGSAHCREGWVIALAGPAGKALEWALGSSAAAALIYMASDRELEKIPDFHAANADALEDMKKLAEREALREQERQVTS